MKPTVEILTDILAEVRPLIGQGKVLITFLLWQKYPATS